MEVVNDAITDVPTTLLQIERGHLTGTILLKVVPSRAMWPMVGLGSAPP